MEPFRLQSGDQLLGLPTFLWFWFKPKYAKRAYVYTFLQDMTEEG